jgi:hypothetical protein
MASPKSMPGLVYQGTTGDLARRGSGQLLVGGVTVKSQL